MSDLTLILLAAGDSSRFTLNVKKQWLRIDHEPLWQYVTNRLKATNLFNEIIITAHPDEVPFMRHYDTATIIEGGATRQKSLTNALKNVTTTYVMVTDIARACVDPTLLQELIKHKEHADCIVPFLSVTDTIVYHEDTIDRSAVKRIQTPQLSRSKALRSALQNETEFTDESSAIIANGGSRFFIEGHEDAHKITHLSDLKTLSCLKKPSSATLIGSGFDVHAFEAGRKMVLGGVEINADFGFKAHSDGDVAIHALIDALLGAAGLGDIGMLFPDNDPAYKDIDSRTLLATTVLYLQKFGFEIINVDVTIMAQTPRLGNYKAKMRTQLASLLDLPPIRVNIKATTTESLGFIGREEGVGVMASASLNYFDWTR